MNTNYPKVTGKKMQRLFNLSNMMRNLNHVPTKAKIFTKDKLNKILDSTLINIHNTLHLESNIGGITSIYGLLHQYKLLFINKHLIRNMLEASSASGEDMTCVYPWETKMQKTCFAF